MAKRGGQSSGSRGRPSKKQHGEQEDDESEAMVVDGKGKGKGKGHHKITHQDMASAFPSVVKATLSTLQSVREVESVLFDVALLDKEAPTILAMKTATTEWMTKVTANGQGHGLGPPHLAAWEALAASLIELDIGAANKTALREHLEAFKVLTMIEKGIAVRLCKVKRTFDPLKVRLIISLRGSLEPLRPTVISALVQAGASMKAGRAPAGNLERKLQQMLEKWKISTE